ncbi:hypothetical protein HPP92_005291 [Vanilla planifolia]|uniref:PGG domain-containing protein n=1 Tax=Vanilla planifolia TaxID=51239 RepID=A0A835RJZ7_VANPL|nr:hypothetical protein HPP92_005291 [Vanilla planifolia]
MDARLQEISSKGDVPALCRLLDEDPLLLDTLTVPTAENTPLHVASLLGHDDLACEILRRRPELARSRDCRGLYPLHIAAAKGRLLISKKILETDPSLSLCRDKDGRTPLHLAAANGHTALLMDLLPDDATLIGELLTERGETVLHLSVRYNQVETVKFLLENHKELVNLRDEKGMTALHLATGKRHIRMIKVLLQETSVDVNALNENGCTALDLLLQFPSDESDMEICDILLGFGGKKGLHCSPPIPQEPLHPMMPKPKKQKARKVWSRRPPRKKKTQSNRDPNWLKDSQNTIMLISTVIASTTFQSGLNPPGTGNTDDGYFIYFLVFDIIALVLSMSIILILISGLLSSNRFMTWVLTILLWTSVSSMALAFIMGANLLSKRRNVVTLLSLVLFCWLLLVIFLFSYYLVVFVMQLLKYFLNSCCSCNGDEGELV